jgi:hypothetical protein
MAPGAPSLRRRAAPPGTSFWNRFSTAVPSIARAEADLLVLVRAHAPLRRAMAALAHRLIARRAWERLGFARLRDYAVERLGYSARSMYDLSHVHDALAALPRIDAAFVRGDLPWTTARLLARVATAGDEALWLERAGRMTAAALAHEVRTVDAGAIERAGLLADDADGVTGYDNLRIRCSPQVQGKWYRTRQLAWRVVGHPVQPWESAEMVAAEVLSALPLEGRVDDGAGAAPPAGMPPSSACADGSDGVDAGGGRGVCPRRSNAEHGDETLVAVNETTGGGSGAAPAVGASSPGVLPTADPHGASASALLALAQSLVQDLDAAGPFQLDRRLRRAVRLEQRLDAEIGARLALVAHEHLHLAYGYARFDDYVREHLGLAPRKMRALLRLERACRLSAPLADAYRDGRLSWVQAHALLPVLLIAHCRPRTDAWVGWAMQVTVRRLQDDVEQAVLLNETDPEAFVATAGLPAGPGDLIADDGRGVVGGLSARQRQIGAQPTVSGETSRLFFHGPRDVVTLFRAVLCTVRRAIERQSGKMPTEGEAFDAMLEHATSAWMPPGSRVRAAHRVFARDGWRCTAPGCSSFQNLHDHHIVFRSAGGSDDLANRTTLCAWHHLRGVHAGVVRCAGAAPDTLRFELGLRGLVPPLLTFGPGERLVVRGVYNAAP